MEERDYGPKKQSSMNKDYLAALNEFLTTSLDEKLARHKTHSPEDAALEVFRKAYVTERAYRDFLHERGIDPNSIKTFQDFQSLPITTKENFIHPAATGGRSPLGRGSFLAVSSGSTGAPTFWPRSQIDELQVATRFQQVFVDSFGAEEWQGPVLAVVCFPLGTWVGGMYTTNCLMHLALGNSCLRVITPGNNKDEIIRVVSEIGAEYEQVVLLGYPPFLKDVIDTGISRGFDWTPFNVKLVMAGEVFSEEWRELVGERLGMRDAAHDTASLYGTADGGVLGNETPLSITIRRFLAGNPEAARQLFGESRLPTLVQYDPLNRYFEVNDGRMLITGDNGIPLVRYNILDTGGVIPFADMMTFLAEFGFDPRTELLAQGSRGVRDMPFVYVFGRSHFAVSFFGANIYPENISVGLEQRGIREWVTGKFVLEVKEDADLNKYLSVVLELAPGEEPSDHRERAAAISIRTQLERLNSEFANYAPPEFRTPHVTLGPAGDPEWFPVGVKHRYTRN